jgi:ribosome biogenesis protein BRX1
MAPPAKKTTTVIAKKAAPAATSSTATAAGKKKSPAPSASTAVPESAKGRASTIVADPLKAKKAAKKAAQKEKKAAAAAAAKQAEDGAAAAAPSTTTADEVPEDMVGDVSFRRTQTVKRPTNLQKLLILGSRSIAGRDRHLLLDLGGLMPHGRPHPKMDARKDVGDTLVELCDLHRCNGAVFLEARKMHTSYLWLAQSPSGPSMKFQLLNVHTADELRMVGNCLKHSRPLLHFDAEFDAVPHLRMAKALLTMAFNTPRYHPRSKPFVDHIICFFFLDERVWLRNYQIQDDSAADEGLGLVEIGPRCVLDPQVLLRGCCKGQVVWKNESAQAPSAVRKERKLRALEKMQENQRVQVKAEKHRIALPGPGENPLASVFQG